MAPHYKTNNFGVPRISRNLLYLGLLFVSLTFSALTEPCIKTYSGEVGRNVTLFCPVDRARKVQFMYLQSGDIFVNGFYVGKSNIPCWKNTVLDRSNFAVHFRNLNLSHGGDYRCIFQYDEGEISETTLHLTVTATYQNPEITASCEEENDVSSCKINCTFHDGFPVRDIQWTDTETGSTNMRKPETERQHPKTQLMNVSSTAKFNCTKGERRVYCSVGKVDSKSISICTPTKKSVTVYVAVAICSTVLFLIVSVVLYVYLKRNSGEASADTKTTEGSAMI